MNKQDDEYICVDREHGLWKRKEPKENVNADRLALALSLETIRELEAENAALREQAEFGADVLIKAAEYKQRAEKAEAENDALRAALLAYVEWHGPCLNRHPDDAAECDAEAVRIDAMVDAALSRKEAQP